MQMNAKLKALSISLILLLSSQAASADSMQQAIQQAITTHPEVLSAEYAQQAAKSDVRKAQGGYLPSVDVTLGYGWENTDNPATRSAGDGDITLFRQESNFLLNQMIFDGFNVANQVYKAKSDLKTAAFQVFAAQELLGLTAAQSYLTVMRNRELVKIAHLDVLAHEDMLTKISKRVQAGAGKRSDEELARSRLALSKANYELAAGNLADSIATYVKVVGQPPAEYLPLPPQPTNIPPTLLKAQQIAIALNPTLAAGRAQIQANAAAVGIAKSAYFPTVTVDLNASYNDSLDGVPGYNNTKQGVGRLNYNAFRGGSDVAAVQAAKYREAAAAEDAQKSQRDILENVAFAWDGMQTASKRIPNLKVHTQESYNVWQSYIKQFQLGQRTLFDLLDSQSEYYDAESALVQAQFEERIDRYRLLAAMGDLVASVNGPNFNKQPVGSIHKVANSTNTITSIMSNNSSGDQTPPQDGSPSSSINAPGAATKSWAYPADGKNSATPAAAASPTPSPAAQAAPTPVTTPVPVAPPTSPIVPAPAPVTPIAPAPINQPQAPVTPAPNASSAPAPQSAPGAPY